MPDLSTMEGQAAIAPLLEGVRLIVVDNISTLCRTGTENESDSWDVVQMWALKQRSAGRSVLFVHHAGKTGAQRGTSKREDVLDTVIPCAALVTTPPVKARPLKCISRRHADSVATKPSRCFAPWTKTSTAKPPGHGESWSLPPLDKVVSLANEGWHAYRDFRAIEINKSNVSRHLKKARAQGLVEGKSHESEANSRRKVR